MISAYLPNMKVRLTQSAGFCFGVKRAMERVLRSAQEPIKGHIYTWGPLIHNPQTVRFLESRGILVAKSLDDITQDDLLIIRSHGIEPSIRRQLDAIGCRITDTTCPRVARVQSLAQKYAARDFDVVIFGDKGHAEVEGLMGFAGDRGIVVESTDELDTLQLGEKVCILSQTTKDKKRFEKIAAYLLQKKPDAVVLDTICDATSERQEELRELADEVDAIVIVGGKNSGNTRRLYEIAHFTGKKAFYIETADELDPSDFDGIETVGVTAGASTPHWITDRVVEKLEMMGEHHFSLRKLPWLKDIAYGVVQSNIWSAGAAGTLALIAYYLVGIQPSLKVIAASALFIFGAYNLYNSVHWQGLVLLDPSRLHFFESLRRVLVPAAIIAIAANWGLLYLQSPMHLALSVIVTIGALVFVFQRGLQRGVLSRLPGWRELVQAAGWTTITIGYVFLSAPHAGTRLQGTILLVFLISLARLLLFSQKERDADRILGRESLSTYLGERGVEVILAILLILLAVGGVFLRAPIIFMLLIWGLFVVRGKSIKSSTAQEMLIDGVLYLMGILVFIW